ncbi:hypothetical protein DBZ45_13250 [Arthrobacter globiformis]|uniref:Tetratricopeptide repeat protein n=2 Tax=Arthrobacter globiformis TaxID=1665 RepID=A0A328HDZ8_ARTGO|nr:tetratricopeptide repeat protein [Arthrobacter globiformis]RAM36846.1 hypothetical protein DBZ45_13250 [Arthrobacter globiformis]
MAGRLQTCSALERVWILALLGRYTESVEEGRALLAASANRLYPLLALAHVFQSQCRWQEAARLHEEALRVAQTPIREATVRHQIGTRLFQEGRFRDAAAEFEWARDLFRSYGHRHSRIQASEQAMLRARELAATPFPGQQPAQPTAPERRGPHQRTRREPAEGIPTGPREGTTTHPQAAVAVFDEAADPPAPSRPTPLQGPHSPSQKPRSPTHGIKKLIPAAEQTDEKFPKKTQKAKQQK